MHLDDLKWHRPTSAGVCFQKPMFSFIFCVINKYSELEGKHIYCTIGVLLGIMHRKRSDWIDLFFFSPVPSPRVISNLLCFHVMFEMFKLHSSHHDKMFSRSSTSLKINKKLFPESSKGVKLMPHNHQNRPFRAEI